MTELKVPEDRFYGRIERIILTIEHRLRAEVSPLVGLTDKLVIDDLMGVLRAEEESKGKRPLTDKLRFRAKRSLHRLLERENADLVWGEPTRYGDRLIERAESYMVPRPIQRMDPLTPRSGYLSDRIRRIPEIVAEERTRLAKGLEPASMDAWTLHMVLSVIGPKLTAEITRKVHAAGVELERHEEVGLDLV